MESSDKEISIQEKVRLVTAKAIAKSNGHSWNWVEAHDFENAMFTKADVILEAQSLEGVVISRPSHFEAPTDPKHMTYYEPLTRED